MSRRRALVAVAAGAAAVVPGARALAQVQLQDVAATTHADNIRRVVELGIMKGFTDGTFRPNEPITRGQVATVAANMLDHLAKERVSFTNTGLSPDTAYEYDFRGVATIGGEPKPGAWSTKVETATREKGGA